MTAGDAVFKKKKKKETYCLGGPKRLTDAY